jgi:hypothetical protein
MFIFLCIYGILLVLIVKMINAMARCMTTVSRALLIWITGLIVTISSNHQL